MAAFSPSTHKVVTASSANAKDDLPVDARVMIARLFSDMGVFQVTIGNSAPADKDVLWWHTDLKVFKRYDAVNANWYPIVANQVAMHLIRRAILGSVQETNLETGDLFCFWDASLGEVKKIARDDLMTALGALRILTTNEGIQGGGNLSANRTLKLDFNGLTAKTAPADGDFLGLYSLVDTAHRKTTVANLRAALGGIGTLGGMWHGNGDTGAVTFAAGITWQSYASNNTVWTIDGGASGKHGLLIFMKDSGAIAGGGYVSPAATSFNTTGGINSVLYFVKH